MFASGTGSMRGPRVKTPLSLLLLLLLLLTTLTKTVLCQYEDDGAETTDTQEEDAADPQQEADGDAENSETIPTVSVATSAPPVDPPPPEEGNEPAIEDDQGSGQTRSLPIDGTTQRPYSTSLTTAIPEEEGLSPIIILIPVVLVVLIIGMIVCGIFISRRWNQKARSQELRKEDPYLDGSSTEKVPMPMFEEDVPSVLELEMEELDQWMKKDGDTTEDSKHA